MSRRGRLTLTFWYAWWAFAVAFVVAHALWGDRVLAVLAASLIAATAPAWWDAFRHRGAR